MSEHARWGTSAAPPAASRKHRILHQTILAKNIFCSLPNSLICLPCAPADGPEKSPHWCLRRQALWRKEIPRWWGRGVVGGGACRESRSQAGGVPVSPAPHGLAPAPSWGVPRLQDKRLGHSISVAKPGIEPQPQCTVSR